MCHTDFSLPQTLLRHGLLPTIITAMLRIMSCPGEEEEDTCEDSAQESQSPITLAGQVSEEEGEGLVSA